jgi:PII-like signaling protein
VHLEGLIINQPLMIETVDEKEKIEPSLEPLKRPIGDNGLITMHEVNMA